MNFIDPGITIKNDSDKPYGIVHVIDPHVEGAPLGPEVTERLEPGETMHLFRNPGVCYVIGHLDSVSLTRTTTKVLKDGTVRRDTKRAQQGWGFLAKPKEGQTDGQQKR